MLFKNISICLGAVFEIYCIIIFLDTFSKKKQFKRKQYILLTISISMFHILTSVFLEGIPLALCSIITVFMLSLLENDRVYKKFILTITFSLINISGELAVNAFLRLIYNKNYTESISEPLLYSLGTLLSKFLVFTIIILLRFVFRDFNTYLINKKYLVVLSVLPITTIIIGLLLYYVLLIIDSSILKIVFIISNISLIVSNIIAFEIIRNQNKLLQSKYELAILKDSIEKQRKHYKEIMNSQEEIRSIRHDMKNSYIGAIAAIENGNIESAIAHLKNSLESIEYTTRTIDTGHPSIDSIIENKYLICKEYNINTNIVFNYQEELLINEIELAIIIGNILDNAIDASKKLSIGQRTIWGSISSDSNNIIINIKNVICNMQKSDNKSVEFHNYGYGLKNISNIAKKYNGYLKCTEEEDIFTTFVITENKHL